MKKLFTIFAAMLAIGSLCVATAYAAPAGPLGKATQNLQKVNSKLNFTDDLTGTIANIIKVVLSLVGTIFLVLTIYAGILWMTAQGDEEKIGKSKNIIQAAIIGLIITLSAYAITYFVADRLSQTAVPADSTSQADCAKMVDQQNCDNAGYCVWDANAKVCNSAVK